MKSEKTTPPAPRGRKSRLALLAKNPRAAYAGGRGPALGELCLALLAEQKEAWPELGLGCGALEESREREIACRGFAVRLQHNPSRIRNTLAAAAEEKGSSAECFLCLENLPEAQKGILYRKEYLILCNPRPIFPAHFTVAHAKHRPQAIRKAAGIFLGLLRDFGPGWTVFYNGPRCGASVPGHLHFQAAPSGGMPIEEEIRDERNIEGSKKAGGVFFGRLRGKGREAALLEGEDPHVLEETFLGLIDSLGEVLKTADEPMVNVAGFQEKERTRLLIFPRRKHRPEAFFRKGRSRIMVSPGLIDMGGLMITPAEKDFANLTAGEVEKIYEEVSLGGEVFLEALKSAGILE